VLAPAKKAGILRDIITTGRAFSILVVGQPNDFTIHVGIGRWIQNVAVGVVETVACGEFVKLKHITS